MGSCTMTARTDTERIRRLEGELELIHAKIEAIQTTCATLRGTITQLALQQGELTAMISAFESQIGLFRADLAEGR